MNYYEVKLEYALSDWYRGKKVITHPHRHWTELVESDNPIDAIEEVKECVRENELGGWDEEEDALWRVSIASRIPVPADCLFFDDRAVVGDGWASDGFIAVPEGRAMWIEKYLWRGEVQSEDIEKKLISCLAPGENLTFSGYGHTRGFSPWLLVILRTVEGLPVCVQRRYYDFAVNQLAATSWRRQPFTNRHNGFCIVAYDADGQAVAYIMPFTGQVVEDDD